jgi:V/A-type H+/Na+-transporting ATPase subunit D
MEIILAEIEITRRRVNALEYRLIPTLRDSITAISTKLSEMELSTLTRLMRVKEIIDQDLAGAAGAAGEGHGTAKG